MKFSTSGHIPFKKAKQVAETPLILLGPQKLPTKA